MGTAFWFEERMDGYAARGEDNPQVGYERGKQAGTRIGFAIRIATDDLDRFLAEAAHEASVTGRITGNLFPGEPALTGGRFNLFTRGPGRRRTMEYKLDFVHDGSPYHLQGRKDIEDDPLAFDAAADLTTLFTQILDEQGRTVAAGILRFRLRDIFKLIASIGVSGTDSALRAKRRFLSFFLSEEVNVLLSGWKDFDVAGRRRLLALPHAELRPRYDVVVVGSGYGGGVMAARLSAWRDGDRRKSICVLERGKEWRAGDFPDAPWEMAAALRTHNNPTGLIDYCFSSDIDVVVGCGLGGTSLINANVMMQPEPEQFRQPAWPRALPDLGPYFERARQALHIARHPRAPLKAAVFREAAARSEGATSIELCDLAVTFEKAVREDAVVVQEACIDCGGCVTGCNYTAKNTVDLNYLAVAESQGAEIFTCLEVDTVERLAGGGYRLHCRDLETEDQRELAIEARQVVLAAGVLGSFGILERSRDQRGLRVSDRLGANFSGNGDLLGFAYNNDPRTAIGEGPTITTVARYWSSPDLRKRFIIEEGGVPRALMALVRHVAPIVEDFGKDTDSGWRDGLAEWLRIQADRIGFESHGALNHSLVFLGIGYEQGLGQLALESSCVRVRWPEVRSQEFDASIDKKMLELTTALGGTYVMNPRARQFLGKNLVTVHPLGGCIMAESAAAGVVTCRGEVFGHEGGLYVADGSIVPAPLGVNPALTIAALAEYAAEEITKGW